MTDLPYRFRFRRGTAAEWTASNEVLLADEGGHERDTNKLKIGDGATPWNSLPYFGGDSPGGAGIAYAIGAGTGDAITVDFSPALTVLTDGMVLSVRATAANATTAPTLNPNDLGALPITKFGGVALVAGEIAGSGHELLLQYSTQGANHYELINPKPLPPAPGVNSIVPGTPNVVVDSTNPQAPVISVASLVLKGRVATYAALPTSGLSDGDSYIVDADNLVYIWNGSAFQAQGLGVSLAGGGHSGGAGTDPLLSKVVSLIPFDGRANSLAFYDLCGNPVIDCNKVFIDSANKQYGKNTLANRGGGVTVFSLPAGALQINLAVVIGTQDFCWEIDFMVVGALAAFQSIVSNRPNNGPTTGTVCIGLTNANQLYVYGNSAFNVANSGATAVANPGVFNKVAWDVIGGVGTLYLNGAIIGSGAQPTVDYTSRVSIGANYDGSESFAGNFANFRFTLGAGRYGGEAYAPASAPFPFA
ncbi:LamG-like jellyroll fold domain-containing protein [Rhodanobacter sp. BL-MT-08]